ncbi:MAG: TlpA family protein disulfide reductase [Nitrospiraceae bacterium]
MMWRCLSLLLWGASLLLPQSATAGLHDLYVAAGVKEMAEPLAAPGFVLTTIEGRTIESSQLRGHIVLVNFWATWCGPCKEEMPALKRLKEHFAGKSFELLAVTTDQQVEGIRTFVRALGLEFPVLLDDTKDVSAAFGVRGLPTTVLIDQQGRLVGRAVGPRAWDSAESVALVRQILEGAK